MTERLCRICMSWHDVENWPSKCVSVRTTARSGFPAPRIIKDFDEPVQSMADGKWYTNKAALAATYKPSGNPRGEEFVELGNEDISFKAPEADPKERREHIKQAINDVVSGNLPPEIAAIQ